MAARILLTGASGQVGGAALPMLKTLGAVLAPARQELDLRDADAVRAYVRAAQPRWIVHPAAYTAVDKAESEPELAYAINAEASRAIGEAAAEVGAAVISFSTDYVFPGDGSRPWREDDATAPLGVYGASKLAGERALAASGAAHIVFRTSWVYGATGNNFLRTILRLAREREELRVVCDQHGAPTWSEDLARLVVHTIRQVESEAEASGTAATNALTSKGGVYHACNAGETTWFGFAEEFLRLAQAAEPAQRFATLVPISSSEYPTAARRPGNSRMSCERLRNGLVFEMPDWKDSIAKVMERLYAS